MQTRVRRWFLVAAIVLQCGQRLEMGAATRSRAARRSLYASSEGSEDDACAQIAAARTACLDGRGRFRKQDELCSERAAAAWLVSYSNESRLLAAKKLLASWNYETNITDDTSFQVSPPPSLQSSSSAGVARILWTRHASVYTVKLKAIQNERSRWAKVKHLQVLRHPSDAYANRTLARLLNDLQTTASPCDQKDVECATTCVQQVHLHADEYEEL